MKGLLKWACPLFWLINLTASSSSRSQFLNDESSEERFDQAGNKTDVGLSPPVGNLASNAIITSNATCGQKEPETFCKLVEHVNSRTRSSQCQICDAHSPDRSKRHPIAYAIDGSDRWWQSPSLQNGRKYEWVTITIDLKQAYQVAYIVIKAALSPRPGNWILEKSLDGVHFFPWQYFAVSDEECWIRYGIPARAGKPSYNEDDEVICTSYFSKISPFEGGEIHTSLVNGRPGAVGPTEKLVKFTIARYVRLRLQKIRTLHADLMGMGGNLYDKSIMRRYFYSIKDIAIGGHCVCFGHSSECIRQGHQQHTEKCLCRHNTCGENCDMCCPLYNQYPWGPGNSTASAACEKCQCHGHSDACVYDPLVHQQKQSINIYGTFSGGGVCLGCKSQTTGVNCEKCETGYFRPLGVDLDDPNPCVRCDCGNTAGSTGACYTQAELLELKPEGKNVGDCHCKTGFSGKQCRECALGFHGYPNCVPCPCNLNGILNLDCEGECICKANVEGRYCSNCKAGYFNLDKDNPDGCTQCFCHGVTLNCQSSNYSVTTLPRTENWVVTDLYGTKVTPALQIGSTFYVVNEEFSAFDKYYWTSAEYFSELGIDSYGLDLSFQMSWVEARGDTSGRPIWDFDVILQGKNAMLAFSQNVYEGNNATIRVTLREHGCHVLAEIDNSITPRAANDVPCSRYDLMEALSDVKQVLLRAKFHTDQIEGMLHEATMEKADTNFLETGRRATSIEICSCPSGYTGHSCQACDHGYRKTSLDSWLNECVKCDCHGHSAGCDLNGTCHACEHNTTGIHCEMCREGFYGNPESQLSTACKPCACPLLQSTNNFSPTCKQEGSSYICMDCQIGYTGQFCERCSNGYFGNPSQPGDICKPCNCATVASQSSNVVKRDEICDSLTGECLICPRNTVGWHCDECAKGFYGNALNGSCLPCDCNSFGAVSTGCHAESGQCQCNERFTGKTCNACILGCGNIEQGCPPCNCDPTGSVTLTCDRISGQCPCKAGVTGRYCNQCLEFHYGFSLEGCKACDCHTNGSDSQFCDLLTGHCHCLKNVVNRNCNACAAGYWNIDSRHGCEACNCDPIGSDNAACDADFGQCRCKPGVAGRYCSTCLDKHYGFSSSGCKACDPCTKVGHICDPHSGRCVCPPNVDGTNCSTCAVGYWGNPVSGCHACNCSLQGSQSPQCSVDSGKCPCAAGYDGDKCDFCQFGYHGYPSCTPCGCDGGGTVGTYCNPAGICSCDRYGQCPCKKNVVGLTCNKCKEGSFGLSGSNPEGCIDCFCFQRTNKCSEGYFKWLSLALPNQREVIPSWQSRLRLNILNNLVVIPESGTDVLIERGVSFAAPLYWQLPQIFLGDKVLSYNGLLRFRVVSEANGTPFPHDVLASYPLVQIQGNHRLILEYFPRHFSPTGYYEVRLNGDSWRLKHGPMDGLVTKEIMMVALQNLQHVLIRGTNAPEILKATLFNVSIDIAVLATTVDDTGRAHGIELCDCPSEYNSTSCQNPKVGYYRWYKKEYITSTVIIDLVGEARPCQCNGRSSTCHTETGFCQDCAENTGGEYCDQCAVGYYGNPEDRCLPCPCPTVWHSHAQSCHQIRPGNFQCNCKVGYTGKSCERCDYGYFGTPSRVGSYCEPCHCNPYGSVSDECHEVTGQCNCRSGITGRDCSKCAARNVIMGKSCVSCDDPCTGTLLNDLDKMISDLSSAAISADDAAVWHKLYLMDQETRNLSSSWSAMKIASDLEMFVDNNPTYGPLAAIMLARATEHLSDCNALEWEAFIQNQNGGHLLKLIHDVQSESRNAAKTLQNYASFGQGTGNVPGAIEFIRQIVEALRMIRFLEAERSVNAELTHASEAYKSAFSVVFQANSSATNITQLGRRLEDLRKYIIRALNEHLQAERIIIASRELLRTGKGNAAAIDDMVLELDMENVMALDILSRGAYVITEMNEVLMMSEDIIRDLRNLSKNVDIRENNLFSLVPLYRVQYAQPAFDHVEILKQKSKYLEGLFYFATSNTSEAHQAITAYDRIRGGFEAAFHLAKNAANISKEASIRIQTLLRQFPTEAVKNDSEALIEDGFTLREILEKSMRGRLLEYRESLEGVKWRLRSANESLGMIANQIDLIHETREELQIPMLIAQIRETFDFWEEIGLELDAAEMDIEANLKLRLDELGLQASFNAEHVDKMMDTAKRELDQGRFKVLDVEMVQVRKESGMETANERLKHLKALIAQAKHKSDTVGVAIGPDETGTCFRLYKWPVLSGATTIDFNFAPIKTSDSLLFYWPSSITEDFIAIEMVALHIKASWDLGSGVKSITFPMKLIKNRDDQPDDPDIWYNVNYQRVGSEVFLAVKFVDSAMTAGTRSTEMKHSDPDESSTVFDLATSDLIHIGGISKQRRPGLVSNGLSGCIHGLRVNHNTVGLWNFVGNEGCAPCTECTASVVDAQNLERDYYFDGRGYSVVKRIQSQAFYSKSFDINMEFRTYAENGLIFLTANEAMGQSVSLEMHQGQVVFKVRHGWRSDSNSIHLETTGEKLNTGKWIKIQALWVYQKFLQTGQLSVIDKQYTQQIESSDLSLDLYNAPYQIGGLSPEFYSAKWQALTNVSFIGCLKNLLIDGNAYDPLSHQYFGVETPCGGKKVHVTSFEGNGYAEYALRPIVKDRFKFGFSFRTTSPTGLLLLSSFSKNTNTSEEPYYAVYLENGEVNVQLNLGNDVGTVELFDKHETRYDDGKVHNFRLMKKQKKFLLFMDDEQVGRENVLVKTVPLAPSSASGLFIGGVSLPVQDKFSKVLNQVDKRFAGCLENLYFDNDVLNFNHPLSHQNQNLGHCPAKFSSVAALDSGPEYFSRIQSFGQVQSIPEEERCSASAPHQFNHEELATALHFGDRPDSYVAIPLDPSSNLRQHFNLTFHFRTFYPHGLFFQGVKKKGEEEYHILSYLKDGQLIFKFANRLWSQELVSSPSHLNDGNWHIVSIVKADDKMTLYIDSRIASEARVIKKMKQITKLYLGGIPAGGSDFLENSIQKPDHFKGCIRKLIINSRLYEFNASSVIRYQVNPCFLNVESGTFFGGDSYAIYMYNFTFNSPIELELEFRTNSKNGELLTFIPDFGVRPAFSIYLRNGQVVASESSSSGQEGVAVESFSTNPSYLCDGQWHSVKANFIGRSISLKVDTFPNVDSLLDTTTRIGGNWRQVTGTLFVGGHDGRSNLKRPGFHGCIKNLSINQYRKDWSDMAVLSKLFLNSCPT